MPEPGYSQRAAAQTVAAGKKQSLSVAVGIASQVLLNDGYGFTTGVLYAAGNGGKK
jgi:hypothetical protein